MKALSYSIPFVILLGGAASLLGLSTLKKDPASLTRSRQAPLVETVGVQKCDKGFRIRVDGEVVPYREISLSAEVDGRIVNKSPLAYAGQYVRKGDHLFEIERRDYELDVRRLQQMVNQAASSIEESDVETSNVTRLIELAQDELGLQRKEVARYEGLKERNATSLSRLEATRRAELQAINAVQTLRNQMLLLNERRNRLVQEKESTLTELEKATLDLSRTEISSPIDGIVRQDMVEADDYVELGTTVIKLEDTSKVEVSFSLRLKQLRWLWNSSNKVASTTSPESRGDNYRLPPIDVQVQLDLDGSQYAWSAKLARYDGAGINQVTRTVPCIAVVDDPSARRLLETGDDLLALPGPPTLLRGMFVSIEIPVGASMDLVKIPTVALRPGKKVSVVDGGR